MDCQTRRCYYPSRYERVSGRQHEGDKAEIKSYRQANIRELSGCMFRYCGGNSASFFGILPVLLRACSCPPVSLHDTTRGTESTERRLARDAMLLSRIWHDQWVEGPEGIDRPGMNGFG